MVYHRLISALLVAVAKISAVVAAATPLDNDVITKRQEASPSEISDKIDMSGDRCWTEGALNPGPYNPSPYLWDYDFYNLKPAFHIEDVVQTQNAPKDCMYGARLSAMAAWSHMARNDLIKMFEPGGWCLLRSGTNLTIKANKADVEPYKVDGQAYKDLVAELDSTRMRQDYNGKPLEGGLPGQVVQIPETYWAYLLGKAMRQWHPYSEGREQDVQLEELQEHAIAYLSLLTGEECAATGDITDQGQQDIAKKIIGKADNTPVIVILPNSHLDYQGVFPVTSGNFDGAKGGYTIWDYREGISKDIDFKYRIPMKVIYIKGA